MQVASSQLVSDAVVTRQLQNYSQFLFKPTTSNYTIINHCQKTCFRQDPGLGAGMRSPLHSSASHPSSSLPRPAAWLRSSLSTYGHSTGMCLSVPWCYLLGSTYLEYLYLRVTLVYAKGKRQTSKQCAVYSVIIWRKTSLTTDLALMRPRYRQGLL